MATGFDRDALLDAFDEIGRAAVAAGTRLQIAVCGGSALMLASNFRFATEDVDIAEIGGEWPKWLRMLVGQIAVQRGWSDDWLNEGVAFHLSALATPARYVCLADEPALSQDPKLDTLAGAIAEYLAKQYRLGRVPGWASGPSRRLDQPWFTATGATAAMREYLTFSSPAEFASRNIFTEERPLRRARSELSHESSTRP